jgi:uncharacterized protein (DUF2267 family)
MSSSLESSGSSHAKKIDSEHVARALFLVMSNSISEGEIEDMEHVLPRELRDLWPSTVQQGRPQ